MNYHKIHQSPVSGILNDTRDLGCGYDFSVNSGGTKSCLEVKGLDGDTGGISFTSKEWQVAEALGDEYYLVIVRNISNSPSIQIIQNPFRELAPKKSIFTTVQVRWNLSEKEIPR